MLSNNLNQQKIAEFFECDMSKQQSINQKDQISLNFTVTSRDSKARIGKQNFFEFGKAYKKDSQQVINLAVNQLNKYKGWFENFTKKNTKLVESLEQAIHIKQTKSLSIPIADLQLLKKQIFNSKYQNKQCQECQRNRQLIKIIKNQCEQRLESLQENYQKQIQELNKSKQKQTMESMKEFMLISVQNNMYKQANRQLQERIMALTSNIQKYTLQRSTLFKNTKSLEERLKAQMQKSRGMSTAKTFIFGGDSIHRGSDSFFFDPTQADYDDWINVFTQHLDTQKTRFKQQLQTLKMKRVQLSKQQKEQLPTFILCNKYKEIIKIFSQIKQIKQKFQLDNPRSAYKQHRNSQYLKDSVSKQNEQYTKKINKLQKEIQCLQNQKRNFEDIIKDMQSESQQIAQLKNHIICTENRIEQLEIQLNQAKQVQNDLMKSYQLVCKKLKFLQSKIKEISAINKQIELQKKNLEYKFSLERQQKKKLHNQLENIKGSIRVYCRIRPKLKYQEQYNSIVKSIGNNVFIDKMKNYTFDCVHDTQSQQQVFEDTKKLIQSAFDGYNVCIFAYGQTGSGKTYTLHGTKQNPGLAPRMIKQIFKTIQKQKKYQQTIVQMNLVEIYLDTLIDMFGIKKQSSLQIKEDKDGYINIANCPRIRVNNVEQMSQCYYSAVDRRKTCQTTNNTQSSRSHCVFIIRLCTTNKQTMVKRQSKICLIDLAGSQRINTNNTLMQKESSYINLSLSCLSKVINCIRNRQQHIPYRDNKLTYLLKDSLNNQSKMMMFVNISPTQNNKNETILSLDFATRVQKTQRNHKDFSCKVNNQQKCKQKSRRSISCLSDI